MKHYFVTLLLSFLAWGVQAQISTIGVRQNLELWVSPEWGKISANDDAEKAIMVRNNPNGRAFPIDTIEGFTFEPGYNYHIVVKTKRVPPPAGQNVAITRYVLVNILEKTKNEPNAEAAQALTKDMEQLVAITWKLTTMYDDKFKKQKVTDAVTIQFDAKKNKAKGMGFCNRWESVLMLESDKLSLNEMAATEKACMKSAEESLLFDNLSKATHWQIKGNELILKRFNTNLLIFTK